MFAGFHILPAFDQWLSSETKIWTATPTTSLVFFDVHQMR